ncbi:hypothetical protein GCM10020358_38070 [Amorphoplanes nipponensis]|uniref:Uncharacterized protein n=1 Tax=Actinoplanes nipponensis TaxID=135950 RepID=A0A919MWQ3_9ACTN|nr:hypothetical protein [Actinoplanes nipponensis]GIE52475.1 hypothetical protein Ani05nite_60090 [Actinoplanes nipponensis]
MPDATSSAPSAPRGDDAKREPPPRALVEAAQHDYRTMLGRLVETTSAVRSQLDTGFTDFEAVADVWRSLRQQQDRPATMLLAAVAIVQLAKVPRPSPLGEPDTNQ